MAVLYAFCWQRDEKSPEVYIIQLFETKISGQANLQQIAGVYPEVVRIMENISGNLI